MGNHTKREKSKAGIKEELIFILCLTHSERNGTDSNKPDITMAIYNVPKKMVIRDIIFTIILIQLSRNMYV
ncbi:hypothetical protein ES703_112810 [subsurface metagenome]